MTEQVFPGSRDIADRLLSHIAAGRVGQPWFFIGPSGSGKEATALEIARRSQCRRSGACRPDKLCESCQKAVTYQHPDIRWLGPAPAGLEDPGKADLVRQIFEDKIRDPFTKPDVAASCQVLIGNPDHPGPLTVRSMQQFLRRRTFQGAWKIAIMVDADRLNQAAANALLKTLEEPPPSALIMLVANSLAGLPATILSRCRQVPFFPYPEHEVRTLLARLKPEIDEANRNQAARRAAGDVRKALDLLTVESDQLRTWTEIVFSDLCNNRIGRLHQAAEELHTGTASVKRSKKPDQLSRRRQALRFCEHLSWLLSESLACRELGADWRPVVPEIAELVRKAARVRDSKALTRDIERLDRAKHHIEGNLNLGLVMAGLFQDLSSHVRSA